MTDMLPSVRAALVRIGQTDSYSIFCRNVKTFKDNLAALEALYEGACKSISHVSYNMETEKLYKLNIVNQAIADHAAHDVLPNVFEKLQRDFNELAARVAELEGRKTLELPSSSLPKKGDSLSL